MSEETANCDVGIITNTPCHLTSYTKNIYLHNLENLESEDILMLKYRIDDFHEISKGKICDHHKFVWLTHYSSMVRKCCDPFKTHDKNIKTALRVLQLEVCIAALNNLFLKLIPGDKICKRCQVLLNNKIISAQEVGNLKQVQSVASTSHQTVRHSERIEKQEKIFYNNRLTESQVSLTSTETSCSSPSQGFTIFSQEEKAVNSTLHSLNLPNWNDYPFFKSRRVSDAETIIHDVCKNFVENLSKSANVSITIPEETCNIVVDCSAFAEILKNLQREFDKSESNLKKLEILSLLPKNWNRHQIQLHFNFNNYLYKKLSHFKETDGKFLTKIFLF